MEKVKMLSKAEEMFVKGLYKNSNKNYARVLRHRIRSKLDSFEDLCFSLIFQEDIDKKLLYRIMSINNNLDAWLKSKYPHHFE